MEHNFEIITDRNIQDNVSTPCFIVSESLLRKNLELLKHVREASGCKILLAQKAFSMYYFYPLIGEYIDGVTASGLYEARLGFEELCSKKKCCENHVFSPAYKESDIPKLLEICDHIVFNSFSQWEKYKSVAMAAGCECGIRINPEHSTQEHSIYDPCAAGSRLGVPAADFREDELSGISGLHFHCLCEQNADALEETWDAVEEKFGKYLYNMKWINFGGGHHITRADYDVERLIRIICRVREKYGVDVYLEPGEAVALDAGFLVAQVLEITRNGDVTNAILDASAACHMPDVLEMPYRPPVYASGKLGEKPYTYRLGGATCLAGDIIGDYSFDRKLKVGDRLVFGDMAIYSMVKTNTFNGMPLPDIIAMDGDGKLKIVKSFGYENFKARV